MSIQPFFASLLLAITFTGCAVQNSPSGDDDPTPDPDPSGSAVCGSPDHCSCPFTTTCSHTCADGSPECHVQGGSGPVDIVCNNNGECHVECSQAASCAVDCGGSADCDVTCPATGCTVTNCVGECDVTCGLGGLATRDGSTATCP